MIRFINPNYHVILIHYPLALLAAGLLIELMCTFIQGQTLRAAGCWMILLGALACAPAATSGIFAKYDVLEQMAGGQDANWLDIRRDAHLSGLQWELLNRHVLYESIGCGLAVVAAMIWLALSPQWPRNLGAPLWVIFAVAMGLMAVGAGGAGEMIFRTQLATKSQAVSDRLQADWDQQIAADSPREKLAARIEYYIDPLQAHIIAAGMVFALAAAAWGTSFQKSAQLRVVPLAHSRTEEPAPPPAPPITAPATALWLATALGAAGVLSIGWYVFSIDAPSPFYILEVFRSAIWQPYRSDPAHHSRLLVHLLVGSGIAVLALLLAPSARWGARSRLLIGFLGLLMLALVAAQIWMGILMLYDSDSGPLAHFNAAAGYVRN